MNRLHELIPGPAGDIELYVDLAERPVALALVAHPHPLFGGTADNKVVTTLARAFRDLHCIALRPQFRGVGQSAGTHDAGAGETDDLHAVLAWGQAHFGALPVVLGGFSFGAHVVARLTQRLIAANQPPARLVLVGTAAGRIVDHRVYDTPPVPPTTLVIHGSDDDTVPLANVLAWAEPQELPVVVIPGADHFFHRRLHLIRRLVAEHCQPLCGG